MEYVEDQLDDIGVWIPAPILFALLMNELRGRWFPRVVQTVTYMPHFISMVVAACVDDPGVCGSGGFINQFATLFGYDGANMLNKSELFLPIYDNLQYLAGNGLGFYRISGGFDQY